jgi:hypothetical protein
VIYLEKEGDKVKRPPPLEKSGALSLLALLNTCCAIKKKTRLPMIVHHDFKVSAAQ